MDETNSTFAELNLRARLLRLDHESQSEASVPQGIALFEPNLRIVVPRLALVDTVSSASADEHLEAHDLPTLSARSCACWFE